MVKYQIVTFYKNPVKGERYAKDIGRHLPQEKRTSGFRARMRTPDGRNVISARRRKGRHRLSV